MKNGVHRLQQWGEMVFGPIIKQEVPRMNIYKLKADFERYQGFSHLKNEDCKRLVDYELDHRWFRGAAIGDQWWPIAMGLNEGDEDLPPGDFPWCSFPAFSKRAVEALQDLLDPNGEILPLICEFGDYYAFNTTQVVDALNEEYSELKRFKSSGRISEILRYEFYPEKLQGLSIFKLRQSPSKDYVTDTFVQRVQEAGLVGFDFSKAQRVWSGSLPVRQEH
jgi:hypothetical protein